MGLDYCTKQIHCLLEAGPTVHALKQIPTKYHIPDVNLVALLPLAENWTTLMSPLMHQGTFHKL